jgi:hypothetical protein
LCRFVALVHEYLLELQSRDAERVPNEDTRAAIDDVRAGRLLRFPTVEALFEPINAYGTPSSAEDD